MNWMGGLRKSYSKKKSLDKLKKAYSQRIVSNKLTVPKSYDTSKSQSLEAYKHTFTIPKAKNKCIENEESNIPQYHQVGEMKINYTPPSRKSSTFDSFNKDNDSYNEIPTYEYTKQNENGSEINICTFGESYEELSPPPLRSSYNNNIEEQQSEPPPLYVSTFSQAKEIYGSNEIQQEYNNNQIVIPSFNNNNNEGSDISKYYIEYQHNNNNISDEDKWIERHSINNNTFNPPIENDYIFNQPIKNSNENNIKIFNLSLENSNENDCNNNNNNLLRQNILQLKSDNLYTRTSSLQYLLDYMDDIKYDRNMINELNSYLYLLQGTKYRDEAEILYNKWNEITSNREIVKEEVEEENDDVDEGVIIINENKEEIKTIVINNDDNDNPIPIKRKLNDDNSPIEKDTVIENIKNDKNNDDINEIILRPKTSHKRLNKSLFLAITPSKTCLFHYHEYDQLSYTYNPIELKSKKSELLTMRCNSMNLTIIKGDIVDMKVNESNKSISCCYSTVSKNDLLHSSVLYTI